MNAYFSENKNRGITVFLRFLHLGIQLFLAQRLSQVNDSDCHQQIVEIGLPISYGLIGYSTIILLVLLFIYQIQQRTIFILYGVNVILSGVMMVIGLGQVSESNKCANYRTLDQFIGIECSITLVVTVYALCGNFTWAQQYCNAPGNAVWPFLFLLFPWTAQYSAYMASIAYMNIFLTVGTFIIHLIGYFKGLTKTMRRIILASWVLGIVIILVCIGLAFISYRSGQQQDGYYDLVARNLVRSFIAISFLDIIFWVIGLLLPKDSRGDLFRQNSVPQYNRRTNTYEQNDLDRFGT